MVNLGSVLSNYKFLCNSFSPGMEATNVPGTAKVLGLNLTGRAFLQTGNGFKNNLSAYYCLLLFCRLSCHLVELIFLNVFSNNFLAFNGLIYSDVCNFTNLDFVFF